MKKKQACKLATLLVLGTLLLWPLTSLAQSGDEQDTPGGLAVQDVHQASREDQKNKTLVWAYKKEFAFLVSEKEALQKRIRELDARKAEEVQKIEREISSLQNSFLTFSDRVERAKVNLSDQEERADELDEVTEMLDAIIAQASTSLDKYGKSLPEFEGGEKEIKQQQIDYIFTQATLLLDRFGTIHSEEDSFFLQDGSKTEGTLFWVGNIAVLGKSDKGSGPLAPAGGGYFKLWAKDTFDTVRHLAEGTKPALLPLYLYDSVNKAVKTTTEKSLSEVVQAGGIIAYVIVGLGFLAAIMLVARVFFLFKSNTNTTSLLDEVAHLLEKDKIDEALKICHPSKGAASRVLAATIRHLHTDSDHLEDIISESILHETPFLERFESAITVFAAVAPLLGLLGTVTGMISTFDVITEYGTGDPKLLSGGISEALITTQLGLMVAIPTLLVGNLISSWADRIKSAMENAALKITNIAKEQRVETVPVS